MSTDDMQFVLSDNGGKVVGVSGDLVFMRMKDRARNTSAFIATCIYGYRIDNVPAESLYKLTATGDFTSTKFIGFDPQQGKYLPQSKLAGGSLPLVLANISIGIGG